MVIEAHKALKKRRKMRKLSLDELRHYKESHKATPRLSPTPNDVNIFSFLSKKQEGYNDLIKQIGSKKDVRHNGTSDNAINKAKEISRSKSCNDAPMFNSHTILSLDRSPRQKRRYSFSDRVTVAFSKSKNYLLGSDNGLLLTEDHVEGDLELDQDQMYENQLDKDVDLENGGVGDCGAGGRRTWDSKEYHPLTFQNANITFIDEENFLSNNLEEENDDDDDDDDDSKAKLSITTCDENIETNSKEEESSESEGSVFTSDCSEHSHSYEKLVEEYAKEENTDSWSLAVGIEVYVFELELLERIPEFPLHFSDQDETPNGCSVFIWEMIIDIILTISKSWASYKLSNKPWYGQQRMACNPMSISHLLYLCLFIWFKKPITIFHKSFFLLIGW